METQKQLNAPLHAKIMMKFIADRARTGKRETELLQERILNHVNVL
jgi:hypothetical protein